MTHLIVKLYRNCHYTVVTFGVGSFCVMVTLWFVIFCDNVLEIPGHCSFSGVGGMRADGINKEALRRLIESHSHTVCVCVGGNDISD